MRSSQSFYHVLSLLFVVIYYCCTLGISRVVLASPLRMFSLIPKTARHRFNIYICLVLLLWHSELYIQYSLWFPSVEILSLVVFLSPTVLLLSWCNLGTKFLNFTYYWISSFHFKSMICINLDICAIILTMLTLDWEVIMLCACLTQVHCN